MSQPDVLHLNPNVGMGGIAAQARDIAGELYRRGRCSGVVLLETEQATSGTRAWYELVTPTSLPHPAWTADSPLRAMIRACRARPERIFHLHALAQDYIWWRLVLAARLARKRVVVTCHHTVAWNQHRPAALFGQHIGWWAAHRLITTTHAGRAIVAERVPTAKLRVVPCGVPMNPAVSVRGQDEARRRLDMHADAFVISCVCRIIRYKGVFDLAAVVAELHVAHPTLQLVIVGLGPDLDALRAEFGGHPAIHILGRVEDVQTVFAASDLFAMPSHEEGFGLVYIEAAMHGVPSIAPTLPTVREVVLDGQTGWLVPPGDRAALRAAIEHAINDPAERRRRGERAREHAQTFEVGRVVDQLEKIYAELLPAKAVSPR